MGKKPDSPDPPPPPPSPIPAPQLPDSQVGEGASLDEFRKRSAYGVPDTIRTAIKGLSKRPSTTASNTLG